MDRSWRGWPRRAAALALTLCLMAISPARGEEAASMNILLIGLDTFSQEAAGRSDVMLLARVKPGSREIKLVSFLRDLYLPVPGCGQTRLNAAYYFGGEKLLKTALQNNFGLKVDKTITVNYTLVTQLIDLLGGVEVEVTEAEWKPLNDILKGYNQKLGLGATHGLLKSPGLQTLDGKQALSYSRIRKPDSDFARTGRQQTVITAALKRLRQMDFFTLARAAYACLGQVKTDLTLGDLNALLPLLTEGDALEVLTARVPFDHTFTDETINGMQVLKADIQRNARKLEAFLE